MTKCKECKEWYEDTLEELKYIKDMRLRKLVKELLGTLWLNNSHDFDIIWYEFGAKLKELR